MQIAEENSLQNILHGELPVLINFYHSDQHFPQAILDLLTSIKRITGNTVCILKVKIKPDDKLIEKYQLVSVNTMILFRKGEVCWRSSLYVSKYELLKQLALYS